MQRSVFFICIMTLLTRIACAEPADVSPTNAALITPNDVLQSAKTHYPLILRASAQVDQANAARREATGAFDATIEQQLFARPGGFYDGKNADTRVVKPIPFANSRVYGGYRISDGDFPIYEDDRITNNDGEYIIGGGLSLLRDRMIDARRLNVANRGLERDIAKIDETLTKISVQRDALAEYWRWMAAREIRNIQADLLAIAEERQSGVSRSVNSGNVARIFLTENEQYILQRQADLNEAERNLSLRTNALSLYLRDARGNPITPQSSEDTGTISFPAPDASIMLDNAIDALQRRPELARLEQEFRLQKNNRDMGENLLMPRADLGVEFSDDQGRGDFRREQGEAIVKLDVSIPLQRNLGEGRRDAAAAAMRALEHSQKLTQDTLKIELQNAVRNLEIYKEFIRLTKDEIVLAETMQRAEKARFTNGDSDFFVLNMREQKAAEARIRYTLANEAYQTELANLNALTMNEDALGLK